MPDTNLPQDDQVEYVLTEKFRLWYKYWTDTSDKLTYANATQSALKAYNYDPVTQYQLARVTGSKNITKANNLCQDLLEEKNWGIPKMLDFAITQMIASKDKGTTWWRNIMLVSGAFKMQSTIAIQNNTIINNQQISPEEAKNFKNDFEQFIDNKYRKTAINSEKTIEIHENPQKIVENAEIIVNLETNENDEKKLSTFFSNPQQTVTSDVG